ncbi:MAG: triose-phosphate isomerase [Solirubrobacterales bacterium]
MSARQPFVAANWKMHKTVAEAEAFLGDLLPRIGSEVSAEVVICPPFLALQKAAEHCLQSRVRIAAQNMHYEPEGAYTGEVSAGMLREAGVDAVLLGHSERRRDFGETDAAISRKVPVAINARLQPILCVGETEGQRDAGETESLLRHQLEADLSEVSLEELGGLVIAYEPIWAIGTGTTATPDQAEEAIAHIRGLVAERSPEAAERVRILYGGSVSADNAAELLRREQIDGALVGGASLEPASFAEIVLAAR